MSRSVFLTGLVTLWQLGKNIYPASTQNENVLWDQRGLFKDNQVIKWIELIYDLREIKHMFCPYIFMLELCQFVFKASEPIKQRMCACRTALDRRCKAKI